MKRVYSVFLILALCLSLCGCQSKAAAAADDLIEAIGTVGLDSGDAIAAAEEAWAALSDEDKAQLKNTAILEQAKSDYQLLIDQVAAEMVQAQIAALGEISLDSAQAVADVQSAFDALSDSAKALVSNCDVLQQAAMTLKKLEVEESLMGVWYIETCRWDDTMDDLNKVQFTTLAGTDHDITNLSVAYVNSENDNRSISNRFFCISEDGFYSDTDPVAYNRIGSWSLNDDMTELTVTPEVEGLPVDAYVFEVREEDGFTKLYGNYPYENALAFVRKEDLKAAFDAKYFYLTSDAVDVHEYFGDPVDMGYLYDENGQRIMALEDEDGRSPNLESIWFIPSKAYEKGLVYVGGTHLSCSGTSLGRLTQIAMDTPFLVTVDPYSDMKFQNANNILFVRGDHVAKNYIDEDGCRTLELTDGTVIRSYTEGYYEELNHIWKYLKADYNDYIY